MDCPAPLIIDAYRNQPPRGVAQAHGLTIRPIRGFRFSNWQSYSMESTTRVILA